MDVLILAPPAPWGARLAARLGRQRAALVPAPALARRRVRAERPRVVVVALGPRGAAPLVRALGRSAEPPALVLVGRRATGADSRLAADVGATYLVGPVDVAHAARIVRARLKRPADTPAPAGATRTREMEALLHVEEVLNTTLDVKELLKEVTRRTAQVVGVERCSVNMFRDGFIVPVMSQFADGHVDPTQWQRYKGMGPRRVEENPAMRAAISSKQPVVIEDATTDPLAPAYWREDFSIRSACVVPLVRRGDVVGTFNLDCSAAIHRFTPDEVRLATTVANQVALAVDNARLFTETKQRLDDANALLELSRVLTSTLDLRPLLREISQITARTLGSARCSMYLVEGEHVRPIVSEYADGHTDPTLWGHFTRQGPLAIDYPEHREAIENRVPVAIRDTAEHPHPAHEQFGTRARLVVPVVRKDVVIGLLALSETGGPRAWSRRDIDLATTIAAQVALAIENTRLFQETERQLRDAQALLELAHTLSSTLDIRPLLRDVVRLAARAVGMETCVLFEIRDGRIVAIAGQRADAVADPQLWDAARELTLTTDDYPAVAETVATRRSVAVGGDDPRVPELVRQRFKQQAMLFVPLLRRGTVVGILNFANSERDRPATDRQIRLGETIAGQVALTLENARLFADADLQRGLLTRIFDSTSDGILLVREGVIETANRRAGELLRFDPAAGGTPLLDVAGARGAARSALDALTAALAAGGAGGQGEIELPHGEVLAWRARPTPGARAELTFTMQDMTREREITRMKDDFVSFVTHQLRTPLSGIRWTLELAAGNPDVTDDARQSMHDAIESASRLVQLVNDMLDIARLERGGIEVVAASVDTLALTREVLGDLTALVADKRHELTVDAAAGVPPARGDAQLLRQVVLNLLSNAVKYTPEGGRVTVRVAPDDGHVHWSVQDNGIGIPAAAQRHLFEKFYRAENATALEVEGSGLGLYLVRLIVERLGGRVWCESEEGRGSTFHLVLPAAG